MAKPLTCFLLLLSAACSYEAPLEPSLPVPAPTEAHPDEVTPTVEPAAPPAELDIEPDALPVAPAWTDEHQTAFDELLAVGRLRYQPLPGLELRPGANHSALPFEARLVDPDGDLEVRLSIRPLSNIEIEYEDAHSSAPEPNYSFGMLFRAIMEELAPKGLGDEVELGHEACKPYGATWGMVTKLDLKPAHFPDHERGILLTLHLEDAADVYLLYLAADLQAALPRIQEAMRVLVFDTPDTGATEPEAEPAEGDAPEDA